MAFRGAPDHALRPLHQFLEFADLGVVFACIIDQRQARGVERSCLGAQRLEQPGRLLGDQAAVRSLPQRPIQQQEARRVSGPLGRKQLGGVRPLKQRRIYVGQVDKELRHCANSRRRDGGES
ncbi:hypothetical protein D3C72_1875100 [compost metagenome]